MADAIAPPACGVDERRVALLAPSPPHVDLNGIDFVEVDGADHRIVRVSFLKPLPAGAYGLPADPSRITIAGGTRIVGIRVLAASIESASVLRVDVDRGGDYSPYTLTLDTPGLDVVKRATTFSFMASCPSDVDCRPAPCPPALTDEPLLDYLAKDYASFRTLLLDLVAQLNPDWVEGNPADLGITLLELLAYEGDRLSYYQDAVANEAYLDTLRTRISARRHARLIDYRMHDGRNAWAPVFFEVSAATALARGTALFTRISQPLAGHHAPPGTLLDAAAVTVPLLQRSPALAGVVAFETAYDATLRPEHNALRIHTWGDDECCLPAGATDAYLYWVDEQGMADRPQLAAGDYIVLEEVIGPATGTTADADASHRALVRLTAVQDTTDPLYSATLDGGGTVLVPCDTGDPALALQQITWARADALTSPLCLSARTLGGALVRDVSLARGNIVLADHGLTTTEDTSVAALTVDGRLPLTWGPLTQEIRPAEPPVDPDTAAIAVDRPELAGTPRDALPALSLRVTTSVDEQDWLAVTDLLESHPFDAQFVAEVDDASRALLRFGDDQYGRALTDVTALTATYRVGNGRAGNVGREAIVHAAPAVTGTPITALRNPLAARDGADTETIEEVRQLAPQAFHSELFRAVTEADWVAAARRMPDVADAAATYRWTGSWTTIFVAIEPRDRADLVDLPDGATVLAASFEQRVRAFLTTFRLAGYDVELRPPRFAPIELAVDVCAKPGFFRADVEQAVRDALSDRVLPGGGRGLFAPGSFGFGQPAHLSRIYAAVAAVQGVESATVRKLVRFGQADGGELATGELAVGSWEIVRLDDDPSFPEHGVLGVTVHGGKL